MVLYRQSALGQVKAPREAGTAPFDELNVVLYDASRPVQAQVVATTTKHLPLAGRVRSLAFPVGASHWLLAVSSAQPLVGTVAASAPWIALTVGLAASAPVSYTHLDVYKRQFENRSFDNLLGRLYQPGEVPSFEGVFGKDLTNPIPPWAEHGKEQAVVPYDVASGMDSPDPDPGEEYQHTNTQLFNILDEVNRFKDAREMAPPYNAPRPGQLPTMDGFVADYISFFTREVGRQPTYEEYRQVMTGYTPEQVPVLSAIARGFGVFDHWFSEVPSQTLTNRSFWTAGSSSGLVVNLSLIHI